MHPIIGLRRKDVDPRPPVPVHEIDVPRRIRRLKDVAVGVAHPTAGIPILLRAGIGYQRHSRCHVLALSAQLRNPDDEGHERAARFVRKDRFLNFERPPKTKPSSWADEHDDTNFVRIVIERRAKRCAALSDIREASARSPGRASSH
jgi:hypothetical protein